MSDILAFCESCKYHHSLTEACYEGMYIDNGERSYWDWWPQDSGRFFYNEEDITSTSFLADTFVSHAAFIDDELGRMFADIHKDWKAQEES